MKTYNNFNEMFNAQVKIHKHASVFSSRDEDGGIYLPYAVGVIKGNTYPIKDYLKREGCRWNPKLQAWISYGKTRTKGIKDIIEKGNFANQVDIYTIDEWNNQATQDEKINAKSTTGKDLVVSIFKHENYNSIPLQQIISDESGNVFDVLENLIKRDDGHIEDYEILVTGDTYKIKDELWLSGLVYIDDCWKNVQHPNAVTTHHIHLDKLKKYYKENPELWKDVKISFTLYKHDRFW